MLPSPLRRRGDGGVHEAGEEELRNPSSPHIWTLSVRSRNALQFYGTAYSGGVKRPSTAVQPPSTMVRVPVAKEPASEAR